MLAVEGLTVRFGDHVALDRVDLSVDDGAIVCVLGPSGSGKSTLLRTIAGLEQPAAGRVRRDGEDLAGTPPHRRRLGLMFQDHTLFPHRDVLGNVAFGPRMRGAGRTQAEEQARRMLGVVGLAGFEHRRVAALSGGEQQRVALARALAPEPALLMLDEPLGALDRPLREQLVGDLAVLFRAIGQSVLFVTHDHDEAFGLADRVAILHEGRVEQDSSPTDLWQKPASAFVATFLGWNVVDLDGSGDRPIAIRPDALAVDPEGELTGVVLARTFHRDHWTIRVQLEGPGGRHPRPVDVVVRGLDPPAPDDRVRLRVDPAGTAPL